MKKQIKMFIYIVMAISLIACGFVGVRRIQVETNYKDVQVAVRYSDILRVAIEEDIPIDEALVRFKEMGATTILVKENVVASAIENDYNTYKGLGQITLVEGYILRFYYPELQEIKPESRYIMTENKVVADRIYDNYLVKGMELERAQTDGVYFLELGEYGGAITTVGVGFDTETLNRAAELGYSISVQIKNWDAPDVETLHNSLEYLFSEISRINNVDTIYFADSKVPGATTEAFKDFINEGYKLGFIEFTSGGQEGFSALAKGTSENGTNYKVIRLHSLEDAKVNTFSIRELMDRYELALKERSIRTFLFKMPNSGATEKDLENDLEYINEAITTFVADATESGFTITNDVSNYNMPNTPAYITLLAGLAAIMVFVLLLGEFGLEKIGYILGVLGIIGYVGLLKLRPHLACQLMALFGSIMFPTYAMVKGIKCKQRNLKEAILALLKICAISFGGVLTIIGVLSKTNFALGINVFAGVKVATIMPILLVLIYLVYREHKLDVKYYTGILQRKISYGELLAIGILGVVLLVYVRRSGNSGTTSSYELAFRQFLDTVLGVRPRTKEILIGYPILLAFLYYGYKERYIVFMIFAVMGPISLVNTYAHIHTPVLISLIRSGYGILIGAVVGLILIWLIKLVSKVIKRWQIQLK